MAGEDAAAVDLAAVHLFVGSDIEYDVDEQQGPNPAELRQALRRDAVPDSLRPFLSCLVAGMHRLPSLTGPVLRGTPDGADIDLYEPDALFVEPTPLLALADPSAAVPGDAEIVIWSSTARRLDGLGHDPDSPAVLFLPGTVFSVVDVDRTAGSDGPVRVLLAEVPPSWIGRSDSRPLERVRGRLRGAVAVRATVGAEAPSVSQLAARTGESLPGLVPTNSGGTW